MGGLHPELTLDWYCEMLRGLKQRFPQVHLKAFTMVEIAYLFAAQQAQHTRNAGAAARFHARRLSVSQDWRGTLLAAQAYPNPDAVQEFSIQSRTFDAPIRTWRGRSCEHHQPFGTNEVHATAFEFLGNYKLNAANFFSETSGATPSR